jgi:hypothetical protein
MFRALAATLIVSLAAAAPAAPSRAASPITQDSINGAAPGGMNDTDPSLIAKAEVLLDRAHFSPGEIDGLDGDNFRGAVRAFQEVNGLATTEKLDDDTWNALAGNDSRPALKPYTIFEEDVAGPFTKAIPAKLEEMARLPGLSYTRPLSEIAEKFHMSPNLLRELNLHADFGHRGAAILVADLPEMRLRSGRFTIEVVPPIQNAAPAAATIVVDKPARNVRAYDRDGRLLAFYSATIGSEEKPAPRERRLQGEKRRLESPIPLRSEIRVERGEDQQEADGSGGSEQPRRPGLDRPHRPLLWDSRHPCA